MKVVVQPQLSPGLEQETGVYWIDLTVLPGGILDEELCRRNVIIASDPHLLLIRVHRER